MKQWLLLSWLFGAAALAVPFLHADNIPDLFLHNGVSLNGEWKIIIDPYESGYYDYRREQRDLSTNPSRAETFFLDVKPAGPGERVEYDFDTSPSLNVPGDWNTQRRELLYYEGSVWYRRKFDFAGLGGDQRVFVRFGAVNYRADVYLNGQKLGTHIGGFTPFTFEVTQLLKKGANSLVVKVDNTRSKDGVPTVSTDWWNYGGITRDVKLVTVPKNFIADHRLALESEVTGTISGWVQIASAGEGEPVQLSIPELGETLSAKTDASGHAVFRFTPSHLQFWSPETPKLYEVRITHGGDTVTDRIGFRTVRTQGKQILLNGKPVFLRGISIHEEFPLHGGGRVNTAGKARQLLLWARELNCNFVRLAHYPHNETMTRLADELGLLVWSEVPVYWTIDWTNAETYQNAQSQLSDNIARDANRASIIIWSLANETPVSEARTIFLSNLVAQARSLDQTRLLSAAMEKHAKPGASTVNVVQDPLADIVDIVAFNEYVGWYDGLPEKCSKVTWEIPYNKPVFISEFGGDARQGCHGSKDRRWTEEYQEDLYRQTLPMLDKIDGLAGFSPWILLDFRSPRRMLPGIEDGFNRKGLISSEGAKKKAFFVLQDYYQKRARAAKLAAAEKFGTNSRVEALLAQMTLDEKIGQMTQVDSKALKDKGDVQKYFIGSVLSGGSSDPADGNLPQSWLGFVTEFQEQALQTRLKIPLLYGIDAVHGHNNIDGAVIFPHHVGLGATHDPKLVERAERVTAEEVAGTGIRWAFAPCIAVPQDAHWGRTYEGFSDNTALVSKLGAAAVRGFQGKKLSAEPTSVLACAKHFIGDGGTTNGIDQGNTVCDEAALRKLYLPPYRAAIKAGVGSIMVSYSSWNGQKMHGNKYLLTDVLKGELGFKGFLVSDWAAVDQISPDYKHDVEQSINAGLDMIMIPYGPDKTNNYIEFITDLKELVAEGKVSQARIDDAVRRILRVKFQMGLLEGAATDPKLTAAIGSPDHRAVARECVRKSLVLLKNEKFVLPLSKKIKHLAVAGVAADDLGMQCGGWTIDWQGGHGNITHGGTTILAAIRQTVSPGTQVTFSPDASDLKGADAVIAVVGEPPYAEMKGDRTNLDLSAADTALVAKAKSAGVPVVTILLSGRPLVLNSALADSDAFIAAWLPGTEGLGVTDVLFGNFKFSGKLPRIWPRSNDPIASTDKSGKPLFPFGFGLNY
jgi:beta-glucuronidase